MMEHRLKAGGLFAAEMELRLRDGAEGYEQHIVSCDAILAEFREQVSKDEQRRAPSGERYYSPYQLSERRLAAAQAAKTQIQGLKPKALENKISELRRRMGASGGPSFDPARLAEIRSELRPILNDVTMLRARVRDAISEGDHETIEAIYNAPGHAGGKLLLHRGDSEGLVEAVQEYRMSRKAPGESSELQSLVADQRRVANIFRVAIADLEKEVPQIADDPIAAMAGREPPPEAA